MVGAASCVLVLAVQVWLRFIDATIDSSNFLILVGVFGVLGSKGILQWRPSGREPLQGNGMSTAMSGASFDDWPLASGDQK